MSDTVRFGFFNNFKGSPTILFFGSGEALQALCDLLKMLPERIFFDLKNYSQFNSLGSTEVILELAEKSDGSIFNVAQGKPSFKWLVSNDEIADIVDKITVVAASPHPCHQYFESSLSEIVIMVSKGEYPDTLVP